MNQSNIQKTTDWIQTYTDKKVYPLEPDVESICIEDIAHSLSLICRFNGHCSRFYSVAEHSLWCLRIARDMGLDYATRLWVLMHDASETYLHDITRPLKKFIIDYDIWEANMIVAIRHALDLPPFTERISRDIHIIDNIMLATERRDLFTNPAVWGSLGAVEPQQNLDLCGNSPAPAFDIVENEFLKEFNSLIKFFKK